MAEFLNIGKSVEKIDALSLAAGAESYTDDFSLLNPLHAVLLYSSIAHGEIESLDVSEAEKIPGVVDILTYRNVPRIWHTTAGQGFPEPSPYDTLLFDRKVRFVGDRIALVAAESLETARQAAEKIKVTYHPLDSLFDPESAKEFTPPIHGDEEHPAIPTTYRPEENLAAEVRINIGDLTEGFKRCDFIEEHTYHTHYASHCAMEPHTTAAYLNERGRLIIITATQVPFHVRRIVSQVTGIPVRMIRVIKPRIGGGFGGKQEVLLEPLAALIAWRNQRAVKLVLSRKEVFISTRTRNPMRVRLKTGMKKDGKITTLEMDALMNTGAYGAHALTVLSNAGAKVLPLFNKITNIGFIGKSVYTNLPVGGAYRGYGATQGYFAFNQQIDILAGKVNRDIIDFCKQQHIREGESSEVFRALGEGKEGVAQVIRSCKLDECIDQGAEAIGWYDKRGKRIKSGDDRVRGVGMAIAMQGSGIPKIDMAAASMKMNEDGSFNLLIGATDIGTGSDTILAQIAAEVLQVSVDRIIVLSSDTDITPFDVGAYASSTTYVSGTAVLNCALEIEKQIFKVAAGILNTPGDQLSLQKDKVIHSSSGRELALSEVALHAMYRQDPFQIQAQASHCAQESPPPFIAQFAEAEVDLKTGRVRVLQFVSAVDCGQPINPRLAEGQVEGAVLNGISYTLCEEYLIDSHGRMLNPGFWDYKIYNTQDMPELKTILVGSYEETGPYGAKSIGEIAINGPGPAIANAIHDAIGLRFFDLPITPERVWKRLREEGIS
jgi:CO/xanthine dehydrogenase Mo-binding subunit